MKKLLASTTAALALAAVSVTGVPGTPGAPENAEAAGCSTYQYKVKAPSGVYRFTGPYWDSAYRWYSTAPVGAYVNTHAPEGMLVGVKDADGNRHVTRLLFSRLYDSDKNLVKDPAFISKRNLDYITCW